MVDYFIVLHLCVSVGVHRPGPGHKPSPDGHQEKEGGNSAEGHGCIQRKLVRFCAMAIVVSRSGYDWSATEDQYSAETEIFNDDVPLVGFVCFLFTRMPGDSYRRRLWSLLCSCDVRRALINSLCLLIEIFNVGTFSGT